MGLMLWVLFHLVVVMMLAVDLVLVGRGGPHNFENGGLLERSLDVGGPGL